MASAASPYGFVPISHMSGTPRTLRMPNGIASGLGSNIFKYQPVKLVSGVIQPITASSDVLFGVFAGVEYTPTNQRPVESNFWPSGSTYQTGTGGAALFDMFVYVWPAWDTSLRFQAQADGSVAQSLMGSEFNTSAPTAGSTTTGLSAASIAAAGVGTSTQGQWTFIEYATGVNDGYPNDSFADMIVMPARFQIGQGVIVSI